MVIVPTVVDNVPELASTCTLMVFRLWRWPSESKIEFQRKLDIAFTLRAIDYAEFEIHTGVRNVQHWRVCDIEHLSTKLQFLGLSEHKLFL